MDIGKLEIDTDLLNAQRRLTPEEFENMKEHVRLGIEAFGERGVLNKEVLDMVAHHHERVDGSGYPQGLKGENIPIYGRIAAIVDTYDAITSHRSYSSAVPPAQAVKHLYARRGQDFQAELVEEFIQAIGIYPAGTLVELSSGQIAIIVAEYRTRRLRPRVMVMLDERQRPLDEPFVIDMLETTHTESGDELYIVNSLEPDAYGIDMRGIQL
jgi:HD-GYP domain-containing protein (c-di-GMP phosphodiesterase class II)